MGGVQEEITDLKNTIILKSGGTGVGVGSNISLSDDMTKYRFLLMKTRGSDNKDGSVFVPVYVVAHNYRVAGTYGDSVGMYRFDNTSNTSIYFQTAPDSGMKIYEVIGYK